MIKEKLTDKQLRIVQVIAGILSAAALIVSIYVAGLKEAEGNILLEYLFVIVFLVIMLGRRRVESKFRLRLNLFSLVLINGILTGVIFYTITAFYYSPPDVSIDLDNTIKLLIIVAIFLVLFIFGIAMPLKRYFKRKENGTLIPIRLPEKPEEPEIEEPEEDIEENAGQSAIEKQISEMTKELDENNDQKDD